MRTVLLTRSFPLDLVDGLARRFPYCRFEMPGKPFPDSMLREAEIAFGWFDAILLHKAANLKWFHSASAGVDTFINDVDALRPDLLVSCSAGIYGVPIAEHLLAMMLALCHSLGPSILNMPEGRWGGVPHCRELAGSTVGIVGYGDIGSHLAVLLKPFGCRVLAFKRTQLPELPGGVDELLYGEAGLDELMCRSDHVCVCLPGTPVTAGLIDRRRIDLMRPEATLLNIGRGCITDTEALADALQEGRLAGAGLDVTDPEPLPPEHRLWRLTNVIITPHISGYTTPHWERRAIEFFARNLEAYLDGSSLPGIIDRLNQY